MKRSFLFYFAAVLTFAIATNSSCKNKSSKPPAITKSDTSQVFGLYVDTLRGDVMHDVMYRVITKTVNVDSVTQNLSWKTDSLYFKPTIDTLRDSVTKKPLIDSAGKAKTQLNWIFVPKYLVWDSEIKVDSAVSRFRKYMSNKDALKKNFSK